MKKLLKIFVKAITLCSIILSLFFSSGTLSASAQNTSKQEIKSTETPPTRLYKPKIETKLNEPEITGPGGRSPIYKKNPKIETKLNEPEITGPGGIRAVPGTPPLKSKTKS